MTGFSQKNGRAEASGWRLTGRRIALSLSFLGGSFYSYQGHAAGLAERCPRQSGGLLISSFR